MVLAIVLLLGGLTAPLAVPAAGAASAVAGSPPAITPTLDHRGKWIVDAHGRVVVLHGMNAVATQPPCDLLRSGFGADDVDLLRRAGFHTMRIGPIWAGAEPAPGVYDEAYIGRLISVSRQLNRAGITPLIAFHQDHYFHDGARRGRPTLTGSPRA